LQHQIAEQKRVDGATAGAPTILAEVAPDVLPAVKDISTQSDVQILLPDPKKRSKQAKHIFADKGVSTPFIGVFKCSNLMPESAFERAMSVKSAFQANIPVLAIDVSPTHFESMLRNPAWITDEEAWKVMNVSFPNPPGYPGYHYSVRETVQRRKSEGHSYLLLFSIREDRVQLLSLG